MAYWLYISNVVAVTNTLGPDETTNVSGTTWTSPYATQLASSEATVITIDIVAGSIDYKTNSGGTEDPGGIELDNLM